MGFCLPQLDTTKLLKAIGEGKFSPEEYAAKPDTAARRAYLEQFVGEHAKEVNTLMESKMLLKDWQRGMVNAVKSITGLKEATKRNLVDRILKMDKLLSPAEEKQFYADIAEKKLGVPVTIEVAQKINELAQTANQAKNMPTDNSLGVSPEYLKAASDLRSYIASQQPVSALGLIFRNVTTTMRNFLLMNISTPLKTFTGQFENSVLDHFTRRLATLSLTGDVEKGVVSKANTDAWKTYRETGLNGLSMRSLDDTGKLGEAARFDVPAGKESPNAIVKGAEVATRFAAKVSTKVAIDWEHNITFTKFQQKAFLDMANIMASNLAKGDAAHATEIFQDAVKIQPETEAGKTVRAAAQYNAGRITGGQDTLLSKISSNIVTHINDAVPGLGNFLFQIVKIPTNLISFGIENAGGGLLSGPIEMLKGRKMMASEDLPTKYKGAAAFAHGTQTLIRTVGVMTTAMMITNSLNKNDFKTDRYGQSYVNIGGTWVNMEYFYLIAPAVAGFMAVKKDTKPGSSIFTKTESYVGGATNALRRVPVLDTANTIITDLTNTKGTGIDKYLSGEISGRLQPAALRQLEAGNGIKGLFFSTAGLPTSQELKKLGAK